MRVWMRGFKSQLSVNPIQTLQNVVGALEKTEAAFYCLLDLGRRGGGEVGAWGKWNIQFNFQSSTLFYADNNSFKIT